MILKVRELKILELVDERASIHEICAAVHLRSPATVYEIFEKMQTAGLITPPPRPKMARSRKLTPLGKDVLKRYGPAAPENAVVSEGFQLRADVGGAEIQDPGRGQLQTGASKSGSV